MTNDIVLHQVQSVQVGLRTADGYINATAMTAGHRERTQQRKDVFDWLRLKRTEETLQHLSSVTGIPVTELYQVFQGGAPENQGTWIHPKLAVRFGMWLSDEFGLAVEEWVEEWRSRPTQPAIPQSFAEALRLAADKEEENERLKIINQSLEKDNLALSTAVDRLWDRSTIKRVAAYNNCSEKVFNWRLLKAAAQNLGETVYKVPDNNYPDGVNVYSHDAWRLAYPEYRLPETTTLVINSHAWEG
jgi:hypothetical protein